jgi:hypothetical protein
MKIHLVGCLVLLVLASNLLATEPWRVVVDYAPFADAEAAAVGEGEVDWRVDGSAESVACTLSYAAVDLREHLQKVATAGAEVVAWDAEIVPERALVLATLGQMQAHPVLSEMAEGLAEKLTVKGGFALVPLAGKSLAIVGYDRTGTLYGAYAFLESLGVRWYGPEKHEWHLPERGPLVLPEALVVEQPAYATRGFWGSRDLDTDQFFVWMARSRLNYWSIVEDDRALLHKLGMHLTFGGHKYYTKYMDPGDTYPEGDGTQTFFEAHPEWYGLNDEGEREPFDKSYGMNLCTTNAEAMAYLSDHIIAEIAQGEWQDIDSLNFWAMDNGTWCTCEPCNALGEPTDRLLLMVHGLDQAMDAARARGELQRPIKIVFPIYQGTLPAPTRPLPADFDYANCVGTYFPILRCYGHDLEDPTCTEYNVPNYEALIGWAEDPDRHYRGELFVCEYYNVSVNRSLPVLYTRAISRDLPRFHELGARHMYYMHTDTHLLGVKRINNYLYTRLLWDVAADVSTETAAYFDHLYGPAAADMRALCDELEVALSNIRSMRYWHHLPERIIEGEFPLFDKEHFQLEATTSEQNDGVDLAESVAAFHRIDAQLEAILTRTDLTPNIRRRLVDDEKTIRYGEHTVHFYDAVARALIAEQASDLELARTEFARSLPHARALRAGRDVTQTAISVWACSTNGFSATRLEEVYPQIAERLGFEWEYRQDEKFNLH